MQTAIGCEGERRDEVREGPRAATYDTTSSRPSHGPRIFTSLIGWVLEYRFSRLKISHFGDTLVTLNQDHYALLSINGSIPSSVYQDQSCTLYPPQHEGGQTSLSSFQLSQLLSPSSSASSSLCRSYILLSTRRAPSGITHPASLV